VTAADDRLAANFDFSGRVVINRDDSRQLVLPPRRTQKIFEPRNRPNVSFAKRGEKQERCSEL